MTRYLLLFLTLFIYSSSAFEIEIDCKDVKGRSTAEWKLIYNRNDNNIMNSTANFDCSGQGGGSDFIQRMPNTIELEDGDSFKWYDLYDKAYEAIRNQSETKEYTDIVETDKNTFVRHAKWSGDDTTTYKIHISITND